MAAPASASGGPDSSTATCTVESSGARVGSSRKQRKRPRSHSSVATDDRTRKLQEEDFTCPVCYNIFEEVYSTVCGHSFCYRCIREMLLQTPHCPMCKAGLPRQNPIHPNFSLNDVVTKYKQEKADSAKRKCHTVEGQRLMDIISTASEEDLPKVVELAQQRLKGKEEQEKAVKYHILEDFLIEAERRKEKELKEVERQLEVIKIDRKKLESRGKGGGADPVVTTPRKVRVHGNFEELLEDYLSRRVPCMEGLEVDSGEERESDYCEEFAEALNQFTRFSQWKEISSLNYGDQSNSCSIVSSIEFDRDGEMFAVGGVTKKIKIYSFANLMQSAGFHSHFPVCEMICQAKLSSVFFNPYHKHQLASSDYSGCVCVWDVNTSTKIANHEEHSKRVWSVVYNHAEPSMYASGSDDCTVKLWCTSRPHSIFTITAKANVCSVRFHPNDRHYLAYGSADHAIHYIDLRNPREQLFELKGHRKAVSYVQFINSKEAISASTDSELKLWNIDKGQVLRTYRGHTNEKNFVGLSVSNNFISCGSEDNSVYVYSKQVSKPMLKYKFNTTSNLLMSSDLENLPHAVSMATPGSTHQSQSSQPQSSQEDFVSSVCWKKDSNFILAANSQGHIKLLEMC